MRYTIPPLFFVSYAGIVSRHRLCRSTNSYVPRCLVRAISVSADYSIFIRCSLFCDTLRNSPLSRPRDERAMTERWPREKNADFLTQNEQKLHIYSPKFVNVAKMYYLCSAQCIGKVIWIVKSTCQKTKYLQKNQANICIFEKFIVPLQHDFDYEECLSQHYIGGGILSYWKSTS